MLESPVSSNEARSPMTGTIEQIGRDIEQIKAMDTNHIFFGQMTSSIRSLAIGNHAVNNLDPFVVL